MPTLFEDIFVLLRICFLKKVERCLFKIEQIGSYFVKPNWWKSFLGVLCSSALCKMCPNTEFFLVRIFLHNTENNFENID